MADFYQVHTHVL